MDFTPLLNHLVEILAVIITGLVGLGYRVLAKRFQWLDEMDGDKVVDEYVGKGIKWAKHQAKAWGKEHGEIDLNTPEAIDQVVNYVVKKAPDAMRKAGFGPEDIRDKIIDWI